MEKRIVLLTVCLFLVLGIVQVASAAGTVPDDGPRMLHSDKWINPVEALNLTDQQITKMREINQNTYEQTRDLRIKMMDSKHELKQLQLQKNPDKAQVDAKIKEINDLRAKIHSIYQESRQQCQSLLTPEQQAKISELKGKKGYGFRGGPGAANTQ
ncbi:Spy/CpxP family protein refolding chaperone [Desulfoscipio gibsoniae]|uniref:P pilus assembly/Cpx signaling pathway, periplasmic inhibitor/zinc-resistance associated protein n=1 Tax=Desulfoscipio gibsoniae DSM 7213 TaxID=767817 RepID=R4KFU0_9FIRM|nr:Spy/CpxP family protein refolding chaperone [Desulfoscipio gibsoniae]AGL00502.1 P pilus assembly/Cpx signaling pathway, periplasmic inhibitor/zinc-resistance associated protein [Desulfoscipio gibsoniae DSM 7213]